MTKAQQISRLRKLILQRYASQPDLEELLDLFDDLWRDANWCSSQLLMMADTVDRLWDKSCVQNIHRVWQFDRPGQRLDELNDRESAPEPVLWPHE